MFTSATGYIFSFGLSRRRHEPPFKPGGSVGALVGRPGFRAGFARIRARGRGRGSVGQHAAAGKSLWIAICNPATISLVCVCSLSHGRLPARPPRVSPTVRVHRHGSKWLGTVDSTTSSSGDREHRATSSFSGILPPLKHVHASYARKHGTRRQERRRGEGRRAFDPPHDS